MTLATATEMTRPRRVRLRRSSDMALSVEAVLMAASLAICAVLAAEGGIEAALFCFAGLAIGARNAPRGDRWASAYSGGFAGLFVGVVFAAFFHSAIVALVNIL